MNIHEMPSHPIKTIVHPKLTGDRDVPVGLPLLYDLEDLLRAGDEPLGGALDVHGVVLVLVHGQVHLGRVQEVADLVQVDLEIGDLGGGEM